MLSRVVGFGRRLLHLGVAVLGLAMANGGYPPPSSGPPVLLVVGVSLTVIGLVGVVWPGKLRTGGYGHPD